MANKVKAKTTQPIKVYYNQLSHHMERKHWAGVASDFYINFLHIFVISSFLSVSTRERVNKIKCEYSKNVLRMCWYWNYNRMKINKIVSWCVSDWLTYLVRQSSSFIFWPLAGFYNMSRHFLAKKSFNLE